MMGNIDFSRSIAFMMSEQNAMGRPGEVEIVLSDGNVYTFSYIYGDIKFEDFDKVFPCIRECGFGIHGFELMEMDGWKYVSLSSGNHLLIKNEVYERFSSNYSPKDHPVYIYQNWRNWISEIIGE